MNADYGRTTVPIAGAGAAGLDTRPHRRNDEARWNWILRHTHAVARDTLLRALRKLHAGTPS